MLAQRLVTLALAAFTVTSCILPIRYQGSVTLAWSVGGTADRTACTDRNATAVRVVVRDDIDTVIEDDDAPCESFRSRYLLDRGWYDATLTLVDARRSPLSETQRTNRFYVSPRLDTFVEVAFAASAPPL